MRSRYLLFALFFCITISCFGQKGKENSDSLFNQRRSTLLGLCELINKGEPDTITVQQFITLDTAVQHAQSSALGWMVFYKELEFIRSGGKIDTSKVELVNFETTNDKELFEMLNEYPDSTLRNIYYVKFHNGTEKYVLFKKEKIFSLTLIKQGRMYYFMGY